MIGLRIGLSPQSARRFSPRRLFRAGEAGDDWWFWRDYCYTKSAGGVYENVTTTGDQIARVIGTVNGIFADQNDPDKRPVYGESGAIGWSVWDGVDDFMVTPSIDCTGTDKMSVFAGVRKLSDASFSIITEFGPNTNATNGAFSVAASSAVFSPDRNDYEMALRGTERRMRTVVGPVIAPSTNILAVAFNNDLSEQGKILSRLDGAENTLGNDGLVTGAGNLGDHPLFIGSRNGAGSFFNGHIYSLIVRGAATGIDTIERTERYIARRTAGVTL
jgi:hypothetical protein